MHRVSKINQLIIFVVIVFFALVIFKLITLPAYFVSEVDEVPYYRSAIVFADLNTVKTSMMIGENVSRFFESDWYGIFYPLTYGTVLKVFGSAPKAYVFTNLFLLILTLVYISKSKILDKEDRIHLLAITIASPLIAYYSFFFMPILLNVFFTIMLIFYLIKIDYHQKNNLQNINKQLLIYICLVLLFSLFRVTFVFWAFALVAFSKSIKQFLKYSALCFFLVAIIAIYMKNFTAPAFAKNVSDIDKIYKTDFFSFISSYIDAFIKNVGDIYFKRKRLENFLVIPYFFTLLAPIYFAYRNFKSKNNLLLAISIVCLLSNFVSAFFYSLFYNFYMRLSVPLFIGLCFVLILDKSISQKIKLGFTTLLAANTLFILFHTPNFFERRKQNYDTLQNEYYSSFKEIKNKIDSNKLNTILVDRDLLQSKKALLWACLPTSTNGRNLIRYTMNVNEKNALQLHYKLKIDYLLSKAKLTTDSLSLVLSNKNYYLYKSK